MIRFFVIGSKIRDIIKEENEPVFINDFRKIVDVDRGFLGLN